MKQDINKSKVLACLVSLGFLTIGSGCSDNDFDLSKIDTTIGVGSDGLELPTSDTEDIILDDILDLNNSDFVTIAENGDYIFTKDGDECTPAHPYVDKVYVNEKSIDDNFRVDINIPSSVFMSAKGAKRRAKPISEISFEGNIAEFDYRGDAPKEIRSLTSAGVSSLVSINVKPSANLKACVPTFKTLTLTLPKYMGLDVTSCSSGNYTYNKATGKITLPNVDSSQPIYIKGVMNTLDFTTKPTAENSLVFTPSDGKGDGSVKLDGVIKTGVTISEVNVSGASIPTGMYLTASMTMGQITILSAKGRFAPEINLGELGSVDINDVPDFLTGDDVKINLYNPSIELNITSNVGIAGKVDGKILAYDKDNRVIATVDVPEMNIKAHTGSESTTTATRICICKYASKVDHSKYDEVKEVANLSELLFTIPKSLRFQANAHADDTKEAEVKLGTNYEISPHYAISAPLAFDEGATIVYRDTIDGWNDDIDDIDFADGTYIEMTANIVNKMPAYLNVSASAIGVDGKEIPSSQIEVAVSNSVKASKDGSEAVTTPITITLKEKQSGAIKKVDGLAFRVEAASGEEGSESIVGQVINARKHTLTARDIKVKLVGRIIADLN